MNKASVWKDKIIIDWDRQIPDTVSRSAIHCEDDMAFFWNHLKGFTRWNKGVNGFTTNLSLQNANRISRQFPDLMWKNESELYRLRAEKAFFDKMTENAFKVKNLPFDQLPQYDYKLKPLGEYQHRGVVFLVNVKRAPLFLDCGMGKTYIVLTSTEIQIKKNIIQPGKTLICAKLMTLESGWMNDCNKFTDLKLVNLWLPGETKHRKERIIELINSPADAYVINHDGLRIFQEELAKKEFSKVVVDESTILKGFHGMHKAIRGGQFGRALNVVSHKADYKVIMSGTPASNGFDDLWGQFAFLDPNGVLMEPNFNDFKQEFMTLLDLRPKNRRFKTLSDGTQVFRPLGPKDPKQWVPSKIGRDKIRDIVTPLMFRAKLRDHIKDMPELTVMTRVLSMDADQKKHYKDMEDRLRVIVDDTRITVPVKLAQIMKLRQITGGFIIDNEDTPHALPVNPKIDALDSILEEIGLDEKVVIYAQFQWEIKLIEARYKDRGILTVYGGNSSKVNLAAVNEFINNADAKLIALHPKSAAHGITFTMAHYMIFYAIDHSAEDNYQCIKRIERASQRCPMFVYYLLCSGSIDKDIYSTVIEKNKAQEELLGETSQQKIDMELLNLFRGK